MYPDTRNTREYEFSSHRELDPGGSQILVKIVGTSLTDTQNLIQLGRQTLMTPVSLGLPIIKYCCLFSWGPRENHVSLPSNGDCNIPAISREVQRPRPKCRQKRRVLGI